MHSSCETFDTNFPYALHYEWEMEKGDEDGKINFSIVPFFYTIYTTLSRCIQNLKTLALIGAEKVSLRKRKKDK